MKYYLATIIDEKPAGWGDEQLLFASKKKSKFFNATLYTDLRKLKRHIKKTISFRLKHKFPPLGNYSWVIVKTP